MKRREKIIDVAFRLFVDKKIVICNNGRNKQKKQELEEQHCFAISQEN